MMNATALSPNFYNSKKMPEVQSIIWGVVMFALLEGFKLGRDVLKGKFETSETSSKELSTAINSLRECVAELKTVVEHEGKVSKENAARMERRMDNVEKQINALTNRQSILIDWRENQKKSGR